jgi:hypothetical protein
MTSERSYGAATNGPTMQNLSKRRALFESFFNSVDHLRCHRLALDSCVEARPAATPARIIIRL